MIPTVLAVAFVGGLLMPSRVVWVVTGSTTAWVVFVLIDGGTSGASELIGSAALGLLNAAVGGGVGVVVRKAFSR